MSLDRQINDVAMEIVTDRFVLRDFVEKDSPAFAAYHADPARFSSRCQCTWRIIRRVGLIQDRGTSRKVNIKPVSPEPELPRLELKMTLVSLIHRATRREVAGSRPAFTARWIKAEPDGEVLREIAGLVREGKLVTNVESVHPLSEGVNALVQSKTGRTRGKIVLEV